MTGEVRAQLAQKKKDLLIFCLENKIPVFAVFADETDNGTDYTDVVLTPREIGITLTEDRITKYSASLNKHFELRFKTHAKVEDELEGVIDDLITD